MKIAGKIGGGNYGEVYMASEAKEIDVEPYISLSDSHRYAIKIIRPKEDSSGNNAARQGKKTIFPLATLREIRILKEMRHSNLVHLHDVLMNFKTREISLVFEYAEWDMVSQYYYI